MREISLWNGSFKLDKKSMFIGKGKKPVVEGEIEDVRE